MFLYCIDLLNSVLFLTFFVLNYTDEFGKNYIRPILVQSSSSSSNISVETASHNQRILSLYNTLTIALIMLLVSETPQQLTRDRNVI